MERREKGKRIEEGRKEEKNENRKTKRERKEIRKKKIEKKERKTRGRSESNVCDVLYAVCCIHFSSSHCPVYIYNAV